MRRRLSGGFQRLERREVLSGASMYVGTNLDGVHDWGASIFADVMNNAREWQTRNVDGSGAWNSGKASLLPVDDNGWPTEIPFDPGTGDPLQIVHTVIPLRIAGTYQWHVEGAGTIHLKANDGWLDPTVPYNRTLTFNFDGGAQVVDLEIYDSEYSDGFGNLFVEIESSSSTDPIRNMDLVAPGQHGTYETQPFMPTYTDDLAPFTNLRFMDWARTNGSVLTDWSERTTPDAYTQARVEGAAVEHMINLANQLQQDAWFTIPATADDDYVRNLATTIRDGLDPDLKVFVEYSNETWNGSFSQTTYVMDQGEALGLAPGRFKAGQMYVGLRSAEIWNLFEQEFGSASSDRLVKVMATQAANSWVTQVRLEALLDAGINPTGTMPDSLAIAPYFGNPVANQIAAEGIVDTITVDEILDRAQVDLQEVATARVGEHQAIADNFGLWLITYEGGQHLVASAGNENNQTLTDKLIAANRDPRMYDLYVEYLTMLRDNGVVFHSNFSYVVGPNKWGSWGLQEDQRQSSEDAPKYRAIEDWVAANPATNLAPRADAGADVTVVGNGLGVGTVLLNGLASRDFDGTLATFDWQINGSSVATGATPTVELSVGTHTLELIITDDGGTTATDSVVVLVEPSPLPLVSLTVADGVAREAGLDGGRVTVSRTGDTISSLNVYYTLDGTATSAVDYEALQGVVEIPSGFDTADIIVTPIDDANAELTEDIVLTISPDLAYNVGASNVGRIDLVDDDGVINDYAYRDYSRDGVPSGSYENTQSSDNVYQSITEEAYSGSRSRLRHEWRFNVTGGDAVTFFVEAYHNSVVEDFVFEYSADRSSWSPLLTLTKGADPNLAHSAELPADLSGDLYVRVKDTNRYRSESELATVHVDELYIQSVIQLGTQLPEVTVSASDADASETDTNPGEVTFVRTGDISRTLTANYSIAGTASNGTDYQPLNGEIVFPAGVDSVKEVVAPIDDSDVEGDETVVLTLVNGANYTLGVGSSAAISLIDDDGGSVIDRSLASRNLQSSAAGALEGTHGSDNIYQTLAEETYRSGTRSRLKHEWMFNVTGGSRVTFFVEAHHNGAVDNFKFAYSRDGKSWTTMLTITKSVDDDSAQSYELPSDVNGTVYVRVTDTNRSRDENVIDELFVDDMFFASDF